MVLKKLVTNQAETSQELDMKMNIPLAKTHHAKKVGEKKESLSVVFPSTYSLPLHSRFFRALLVSNCSRICYSINSIAVNGRN